MPPRGGEATERARRERPEARTSGSEISAADELNATEWHALMEAALDDLAWLQGGRIPMG